MATVTRYVNTASTAGGDGTTNATTGANRAYASLSEWESNEQTDLVSDGDIHHCIFEGSDTTAFTISGWTTGASNYIKITVASANRHAGTVASGAKIKNTTNGSHVITVSQDYTWIEYLIIQQDSTGSSDEGVRITSGTNNVILSRNIIYTDRTISDQDGVYSGNWACDYAVDNCFIYGFGRGGIDVQNYNGSNTQTVYSDHNFIVNCGTSANDEGGIISNLGSSATNNINVYNTSCIDCAASSAMDFQEKGLGTHNWSGSHNACSDTSLTSRGLNTGKQESLTLNDTTQTSGSHWLVNEKDSPNFDWLLLDESSYNKAASNGTNRQGSEPDSRQDFSIDIVGNSRPTTNVDIGANQYTEADSDSGALDAESTATASWTAKASVNSDASMAATATAIWAGSSSVSSDASITSTGTASWVAESTVSSDMSIIGVGEATWIGESIGVTEAEFSFGANSTESWISSTLEAANASMAAASVASWSSADSEIVTPDVEAIPPETSKGVGGWSSKEWHTQARNKRQLKRIKTDDEEVMRLIELAMPELMKLYTR